MKPTAEQFQRAYAVVVSSHLDGHEWGQVDQYLRDAIAQALADEHERAMERAAKLCEEQHGCETDLGFTYCEERYAAAIRAAAKGE